MIQFTVNITGAAVARRAIPTRAQMENLISEALTGWAIETLDGDLYGTQNYAPPPPNSKYIRTGNLGANWGLRRGGKMSVVFTNNMHYAGYVVGGNDGRGQAGIHAGRWWIARRRIEERLDRLADRIQDRVDAL